MDDAGNYFLRYENSFTRLLTNVEHGAYMSNFASYEANGTSYPMQSMVAMTSYQEENNNQINDNIYIDEFGIDHVDDIDQSSEDEDTNELDVAAHMPNQFPNHDEFYPGQLFDSLEELKRKITIYAASKGRDYKVKRVRDGRISVACVEKDKGCTWDLSAYRIKNNFVWKVDTYDGPHIPSCVRDAMHTTNRNINKKLITQEIVSLIREDKALKPKTIMQILQDAYHLTITYKRAWGAKQREVAIIFGDWEESYAILPRFMTALQQLNPGTVVEWSTVPSEDGNEQVFRRVFWSFGPCIQGFQHCRPLITLDGTTLYEKYNRRLLIATVVDANNQIFPLAFAIVESENCSSWAWFMDIISRRVTQRTGLCAISDRHQGIMKAMRELPRWKEPNAFHRNCVRHLVSDFNSLFKEKHLKRLFGSVAYIHEEAEFESELKYIGSKNSKAQDYLEQVGREKWSLFHDNGLRYGVMTTNMSECFTGEMKGARSLPVTSLVQSTFYKLNSYFVERRSKAEARSIAGHKFSKKIESKLEEHLRVSRCAQVTPMDLSRHVYEVQGPPVEEYGTHLSYIVDLINKTCTCQRWRNLKVPCPHVLAVCWDRSFDYITYIDHCYTTEAHVSTYKMAFNPVGDILDWPRIEGPPLIPDSTKLRKVSGLGGRKIT